MTITVRNDETEYADMLARMVLAGDNPVIRFGWTYALHDALERLGAYDKVAAPRAYGHTWARVANQRFYYRVDHGNNQVTQNTMERGQRVPLMEDIEPDTE